MLSRSYALNKVTVVVLVELDTFDGVAKVHWLSIVCWGTA